MNARKLVAFDMDGTLIRNTDSVSLLCNIRGTAKSVLDKINEREDSGEITWIEADYERAKLINGLELDTLRREFNTCVKVIFGLKSLLDKLKQEDFITVLITAGPIQVAEIVANKYNFDYYFGSIYEVVDGKFTEKIINHMGSTGKLDCLNKLCKDLNIKLDRCVAVGDSLSDLDLFKNVGFSVALNPSKEIEQFASVTVCSENILDILNDILNSMSRVS